jgi:hypothetical protein
MTLGTITPTSSGGTRGVGGETPSPDFSKIPALKSNFDPIPAMETADLTLAQDEFLQESGRIAEENRPMITAIVQYKLPLHIDLASCAAHFRTIAPGFRAVPGLIRKQFIYAEDG